MFHASQNGPTTSHHSSRITTRAPIARHLNWKHFTTRTQSQPCAWVYVPLRGGDLAAPRGRGSESRPGVYTAA